MNYFELFDIEINLFPDEKEIKNQFYLLSKKYHPDINQASDPEKYVEVLEMSGKVNEAYKTLTNLNLLLKYLLDCFEAEMDANEQLEPSFLMEMMELNEAIMEGSQDEARRERINTDLDQRSESIVNELRTIWLGVEKASPTSDQLEKMKSAYYRQKYLLRIRKNLNSFAEL